MTGDGSIATHVVLRLTDDRVVASDVGARRRLARVVQRVGGPRGLLVFRAADTHVHLLVQGDSTRFSQAVASALRQVLELPVGFAPARRTPVTTQSHLVNTLHYILRQESRHGLDADAMHEASSLPDLLGFRLGGEDSVARVRALLPRLRGEELRAHLGGLALDEGERVEHLAEAVGAALLVERPGPAERRVAVAAAAGVPSEVLAAALGVDRRTVQRLRAPASEAAPTAVRAVRRQMGLRAQLPPRAPSFE